MYPNSSSERTMNSHGAMRATPAILATVVKGEGVSGSQGHHSDSAQCDVVQGSLEGKK
jgi:hypothetical protein